MKLNIEISDTDHRFIEQCKSVAKNRLLNDEEYGMLGDILFSGVSKNE